MDSILAPSLHAPQTPAEPAPPAHTAEPRWLRHPQYTRDRLRQIAHDLRTAIFPDNLPPCLLTAAGPVDRISFDAAEHLDFTPVELGRHFGPRWATYWFKLQWQVPESWERIFLRWNSHSEATLWHNGVILGGLNPGYPGITLPREEIELQGVAGKLITLHVEMACNGEFGVFDAFPGIDRPDNPHAVDPFWLDVCQLTRRNQLAWSLWHDLEFLRQLEADRSPPQVARAFGGTLPLVRPALETAWAGKLLCELNRFANAFDLQDPGTWAAAGAILAPLLKMSNGSVAHELSAIGHAHIDTAWLWPLAETRRKCQRSFSTAVTYMDEYPDYRFACSQAYQYEQIEKHQPELFARIDAKVRSGQWQFVGGSWIEPDCNIPSGESLCRQLLLGQRYFQEKFGRRCREFWNPDVFGYNGQLPQILRHAGIKRFLTQKLSWNAFTQPQHHTFYWQGIDGSEVLTHFPPGDTYNGTCEASELRYHAANYKEADRGTDAYYLFGCGDGGGGPTRTMLEFLSRAGDLQGLPRCQVRAPQNFFDRLEANTFAIPRQVGELYFEYHRGTYTTQAQLKRLNRRCEEALHDLEFFQSAAQLRGRKVFNPQRHAELWKVLLLHQFHDILPGSSIPQVNQESRSALLGLLESAEKEAHSAAEQWLATDASTLLPVNTLGMARREILAHPDGRWVTVETPAYGAGSIVPATARVMLHVEPARLILENRHLRATLDTGGRLRSLRLKPTGEEILSAAGNQLVMYRDEPAQFDAWDIEPTALETGKACAGATGYEILDQSDQRIAIRFDYALTPRSSLRQTVILDAVSAHLSFETQVEWHERHRLLKVEFPTALASKHATYEIQFGTVERPTHQNTQADIAQFEVPAHRWCDLSETALGLAIFSDSKYGYSVSGAQMTLSLLRSSTYPDAQADQGTHHFRYGLYPHSGSWREAGVVNLARAFNQPIRWLTGPESLAGQALFQLNASHVVLDTIKPAEDGDGLVLRLYEAHGQRGRVELTCAERFSSAWESNTLEDLGQELEVRQGRKVTLAMGPYQLRTLRIK